MEILQNRLQELRRENNITQKELAMKIGTSASAVGFWENGVNEPKASYIYLLAKIFGVSTDFLLGLEDDFGVSMAAPRGESLTAEERKIIEDYRNLNKSCKTLVKDTIKTLLGTSGSANNKQKRG